jgi:hypothetical protein
VPHYIQLKPGVRLVQVKGASYLRLGDLWAGLDLPADLATAVVDSLRAGTSEDSLASLCDAGLPNTEEFVLGLAESPFVERVPTAVLPRDISVRFDRQLTFMSSWDHVGIDRHERMASLLKAKVCLVGIGGIGNWILGGLLNIGVGSVVICDADDVTLSNLNRSILFDSADVGRPKAVVAAEKALRLWPDAKVEIEL